ncbi:DUF4030 domain-containing protein [Halobacillus sp. K22]|uniref:DUF4030 domain-containing protein n=1 Tax=Halobacillus sp. K22 TaxID=3457431 RepID=UPI003FCC74AC
MKGKWFFLGSILITCVVFTFVFLYHSNKDQMSEQELEKLLVQTMKEAEQEEQEVKKLLSEGPEYLKNEGYPGVDLSFSAIGRKLTVQVSDKELLETQKDNIRERLVSLGKEIGLEDLNFDFMYVNREESWENDEVTKDMDHVLKIAADTLSEKGASYNWVQITPNESITIQLQEASSSESEKRKWKEAISEQVYAKTKIKYQVNLSEKSKSEKVEQSWDPVFTSIQHQISMHFEEYRGFAYSFHPQPLQIIIKTHVGSWTWNTDAKVEKIERYVNKVIELKKEEAAVEEVPYELIIRDKNNNKIN